MVGAGGIGCELLKNLVMTGFTDIELIDLDTIDVSNLNRQFLFRQRHVGQPKAEVARDAALAMRPGARIVAHHGNIMAPEFDVDFFSKFSVVLNALDNLAARRHVNRMCLAAGVPLIDSGTAGYLGQVTVHIKSVSQCYECEAKPAPKGFPTCTITNTPSKPVHCIVWAKELPFLKLFGDKTAVSDLDTAATAGGGAAPSAAADDVREIPTEASGVPASEAAVASGDAPKVQHTGDFYAPEVAEEIEAFAERVFDRLFGHNVAETLRMEDMWKSRAKPTPHFLRDVLKGSLARDAKEQGEERAEEEGEGGGAAQPSGREGGPGVGDAVTNGGPGSHVSCAAREKDSASAARNLGLLDEHAVWSLEENARLFLECVRVFFKHRSKDIGSLTFDKDDDLAVQFVAAASNIRAHSFGIPMQSLFAVKGIAGSIIHAIATTNAIVAGLAVLQTLRVLRGQSKVPQIAWCHHHATARGQLLQATEAEAPNPKCHACAQTPLLLELNTETTTLESVLSSIIKQQIGSAYPTLTCGDALLYEEGADLDPEEVAMYAANAKKKLSEFAKPVRHGSVLTVEDYHQHFKCDIHIKHRDTVNLEEHPSGMILQGSIDLKGPGAGQDVREEGERDAEEKGDANHSAAAEDSDDEVMVVLPALSTGDGKRKIETETSLEERATKKAKKDTVITIEDDD